MSDKGDTRVLILIPNLGRGGAQKIFRQQLKYLSLHFQVTGCVFNWDGAFSEDRQNGTVSLDVPAGRNLFFKVFYFFQRIIRLRRIKKELSIDLTISHLEGADYVNILSRRKDKAICWIHGTKEFDKNINGWLGNLRMNLLIPFLYKRSDKLVTVSKGIKRELIKNINGIAAKIEMIYNGFDVDEMSALSQEELDSQFGPLFKDFNILITHCRLSRQKNLEALITVYQQLHGLKSCKLVIVGDGELRDNLILLSEQLGLKPWSCWYTRDFDFSYDVYFIGQQQNPFKFLRRSFLFIMTSNWEGFPLSLGEALACGLNVISTDCYTGPREIIAPELILAQPILNPYKGSCGVLMPMVDVQDSNSILLWVSELKKMIIEVESDEISNQAERINRVKEFSVSESMNRTVKLVKQFLV